MLELKCSLSRLLKNFNGLTLPFRSSPKRCKCNVDRRMPVHATSPSKVSTSFQRWNQPHYRTSCYVIPLFPPPILPCARHLMQLLQRVSNAFQHNESLSIFIEELTATSATFRQNYWPMIS